MNTYDPIIIRKDFPFFEYNPELIYLDSAATSQKPQAMIDAMHNFYAHYYAPVHRGIYTLAEDATAHFEETRKKIAAWIGAHSDEIIFTRNTTSSINMIATSWAAQHMQAGDEILLTELEHHANLAPWLRLAHQRGIIVRFLPVIEGLLDDTNLEQYITDHTKLVAITHGSNTLGTHVNVSKIAQAASAVGARVLVDAAQTAAHERLSVQELGADFLVFSPHKMGGPTGLGILYISKNVHHELVPYEIGGSALYDVSYEQYTMREMPYFFEAGTPPIAEVIAFSATLDYIQTWDFDALQRHEAQLCAQLIGGLMQMSHIKILGPKEQLKKQGHLVSFIVKEMHAHDVAAALNNSGICVRAGHHCAQPIHTKFAIDASIRASFYAYTTQKEISILLEKLGELA